MAISVGLVAVASDVNVALGLRSQYAWGTYSGNGTASRQITTGFLCGSVAIRTDVQWWESHESGRGTEFTFSGPAISTTSQVGLHGTNGFVVGGNANSSTLSYGYMTFSRA